MAVKGSVGRFVVDGGERDGNNPLQLCIPGHNHVCTLCNGGLLAGVGVGGSVLLLLGGM